MVEQDTIKLLRECDAGVKMGVASIDDVLEYVSSTELKKDLTDCKSEHEKLNIEIQSLLEKYKDDGKDPTPGISTVSAKSPNFAVICGVGTLIDPSSFHLFYCLYNPAGSESGRTRIHKFFCVTNTAYAPCGFNFNIAAYVL